jgi:tripartite-type tricarboxylate transporter receptor subunit TctC
MVNRTFCCAVVACALSSIASVAHAQDKYPSKVIRLVSPFSAGGGSDTCARLIATPATETFGQPVVVENRPGAGGNIGATYVANSPPDGYTFAVVSGSYGANAALYNLPWDSVDGITPIILIGTTPLLASVHTSVSMKTMKELIAFAKAHPGKLTFGSSGLGSLDSLAVELLKLQTGTNITLVPYKGSAPVMTALLSGEVDSTFTSLVPSMPHIKSGRLRAIAVTTAKRSRVLPDVPTVAETVPGFDVTHWYAMWGPKGIPKDIVMRWNTEAARILKTDAVRNWMAREGLEAAGGSPEELRARLRADVDKWKKVVKEAHIVVQ